MGIKKTISRIQERLKAQLPKLAKLLNRFHPPGMKGAGLYDVLYFTWKGMSNQTFALAAMAMAYRFFFSIFPTLILVFTLVPYVPIENFQFEVMRFMGSIVPQDSLGFVTRVVDEFFGRPSAGVIYLNLGLVLFSAVGGIKVMMQAFTRHDAFYRKRNTLHTNIVATVIFLVLMVVFAVMLFVLIGGEYLISYIDKQRPFGGINIWGFLLRVLYWLVNLAGLQMIAAVIYYFAPSRTVRWKFFSPGSLLAGVLILLAITGFRLFVSNFADYNKIYGSLGAIMVLMVWFYWISSVLLIGFELNAAVDVAHAEGRFDFEPLPPYHGKKGNIVKEEPKDAEGKSNPGEKNE